MTIHRRLAAVAAVCLLPLAAVPVRAGDAVPQNDLLNAALYMAQAVEYKASVLGIFQLARMRLDQALADPGWTALPEMQGTGFGDKPAAIILDADETVLDNSPYEASLVIRGTDFSPREWTAYVKDQAALAVPGAVDFTRYAASRGVKVFYVTSRTLEEKDATVANLERLGFPMGGNVDTVLVRGQQPDWKSAKGTRWQAIARDYRVLLMIGDNLGDFTDDFGGSPAERVKVYEAAMAHWGKDWIMLPNAEYGSWESAPFGSDYKLPPDARRRMKIESLKGWAPKP